MASTSHTQPTWLASAISALAEFSDLDLLTSLKMPGWWSTPSLIKTLSERESSREFQARVFQAVFTDLRINRVQWK
jgi:hypothetical protein